MYPISNMHVSAVYRRVIYCLFSIIFKLFEKIYRQFFSLYSHISTEIGVCSEQRFFDLGSSFDDKMWNIDF